MIEIFVDGSYFKGTYSGAFVVYEDGDIVHQDCGIGNNKELAKQRNIAGEMTAAIRAAHWLHKNNKKGTIVCDYTGLKYWATKQWQARNVYTKKYAAYMNHFVKNNQIDFKLVKGHTGVEGNEIADRLARQAITFKQGWKIFN